MKVLLLTRYGSLGASSRLRAVQYLPYLKAQGFDVTWSPLFGDYYQTDLYSGRPPRWSGVLADYLRRCMDLLKAARFDLLWLEYELFPWLPGFGERLLTALRIPYVVDYDDAIYHRYELHPAKAIRLLLGGKIDRVIRQAAAVMVGNPYLEERAIRAGATDVNVLPTAVDLRRYTLGPTRTDGPFTVGWIGSPSTAKYLEMIEPVLTEFSTAFGARVVVVGAQDPQFAQLPFTSKAWSEQTEVNDILSFDVGVMPLPDEPWARGKSGYKLIQYMACGRPVIASPVGVNSTIIQNGVNGLLASTSIDWFSALATLYRSTELRAQLGSAGRRTVETNFSTSVIAPRLADVLTRAGSDRGRSNHSNNPGIA